MRDVPLHADHLREGNVARSSCTFTMRSFRGVHGNHCGPANICRTGCSKARHGPSMPVRGPTRVQHQMWLKWNNKKWFMLVWVCAGQRDPCDMRWRLAYPCARARSSLAVAISRRRISLPFSEALTLVYYGAFPGWWMAEKPGAEGDPGAPGEKTAAL